MRTNNDTVRSSMSRIPPIIDQSAYDGQSFNQGSPRSAPQPFNNGMGSRFPSQSFSNTDDGQQGIRYEQQRQIPADANTNYTNYGQQYQQQSGHWQQQQQPTYGGHTMNGMYYGDQGQQGFDTSSGQHQPQYTHNDGSFNHLPDDNYTNGAGTGQYHPSSEFDDATNDQGRKQKTQKPSAKQTTGSHLGLPDKERKAFMKGVSEMADGGTKSGIESFANTGNPGKDWVKASKVSKMVSDGVASGVEEELRKREGEGHTVESLASRLDWLEMRQD